jgi:hypothetical protein
MTICPAKRTIFAALRTVGRPNPHTPHIPWATERCGARPGRAPRTTAGPRSGVPVGFLSPTSPLNFFFQVAQIGRICYRYAIESTGKKGLRLGIYGDYLSLWASIGATVGSTRAHPGAKSESPMITQENSCFTITATIESRPIRNAYGGYVASLRDSNSYQLDSHTVGCYPIPAITIAAIDVNAAADVRVSEAR